MDVIDILKSLNTNLVRLIVNFTVVFCFWSLAIYMLKPEIVNQAIYVQFILTFCLNFVWYIIYFFIAGFLEGPAKQTLIFELASILSIISISLFILIAYYYSFSFTQLLRWSFPISLCFVPISMIIAGVRKINSTELK